jgi:hypothetical protein
MFLSCVLIHSAVKAQLGKSQTQYFLPQPFPRSPAATAFEKYGTYQVNEFTGVPDISIPLYTIEAGGFQLPITLSYHASGIKVTDVASWAGLGWSVSAGGQISRKTIGLPDDIVYGYLNGFMYQPGTYSSTTLLGLTYMENVANGTYDSKPDIYSYDFPGHGGKFFFDGRPGQNFVARTVPYAPLSIKYTLLPYSSSNPPPNTGLTKFNITDEHGDNYTFGNGATDVTFSASGGKPGSSSATAWKLQRMIRQNKRDTVSLSYQSDVIDYPSADGEIFTVVDQIDPVDTDAYRNATYSTTPTTPGNANVTTEQLLSQITFKNGKVVFELDPSVRQDVNVGGGYQAYGLKDIKVYLYNYATKAMELQKTIVFQKSYFYSGNTNRLRLDGIQVLDKAGSVVQQYSFDYNQNQTLPQYTSYSQDYWGYYNGKANNMLTPQQTITYQPYTINPVGSVTIGSTVANGRDCDSTYMQAFVLTGIHYPTGGYSTFTYQTNQYYDQNVFHLAGGLRIKTISSYDGVNPTPIVKTYVYNSARPNFILDYGYFSTSQIHRYYTGQRNTVIKLSTLETVRTFSSNPHADLEAYDGATVVYPSVTEYIGTPGTNVGRTDYTFTDQQDATSDASMAGNVIYISSFYKRGHLQSKSEYIHLTNGSYQLAKTTGNSYTAFPYTNYNNVGLAIRKINYNEGNAFNPIDPGITTTTNDQNSYLTPYYYIASDDNYLTGTTTSIYDINDPTKYTSSTISYQYDDTTHQQIAYTTHTDSKGNTHISSNKYAYNYLNGGTTTNNAVLDSMISRHMFAEPVEKWDSLRNAATGVNAVISAQLNLYALSGYNSAVIPSKISTLSVLQPLTNFAHSSVVSGSLSGDSRYVQMISFDQYDPYNNIIQYTPRNTTPVSIIWDYLHGAPIAQVKNATWANTAYTSFEADGKGGWFYSGTPVFDPTAPTGSMVYPLSTGSISSSSLSTATGYFVSYWSNNGPATVNSAAGTSYRTANGWTYYEHIIPAGTSTITISGGTSIDELRLYPAFAQMTTYAYNPSGVSAIADTKGAINYFEYDYFGRLKNAKDWNGNIVKNYGYHTYDQTSGNQAQSGTFTRNNCPSGTNPQSLTYTVPANKYYASTLASANADAVYDMNVNGQIKANQVCGCPVSTISFTLSNTTGLSGFQATFSGISTPFNFPSSGSPIVVQVPAGTYATVSVNAVGSNTHTFTMGSRTPVTAHNVSFSTVVVASGSSDLNISIQ